MRRAILLTALVLLPLPAQARGGGDQDDRPFRRGTILPSVGLGGSYSRNYGGSLAVGAGASYFVVGGLALGLHFRNVTTFFSRDFKEYLGPELLAQIPTNEFSLMPGLTWVIYRGDRVAPYIGASLGPVFLNKKRGVLGQWSVGPGVMIGTGGPMWIDLGIGLTMRFTRERCEQAYTFVDPVSTLTYTNEYACGLIFGFRGGIVFGLGGRRQAAPPPARPSPPPSYTSPPASSYPAPAPAPVEAQPVSEDSPNPSAAAPLEPTPEGPPPAGEPPASAPESAPPATTTPPGENLPVPPPA